MRRRNLRLPLAMVGAVLAGELAVWLLRPTVDLQPIAASERAYFSSAQLERASDFAGTQVALGVGSMIAQGALLVALVAFPPRRTLAAVDRVTRGRPLFGGALVGAGLLAAITVVGLPFSAGAHQRAVDFGLSTQAWGGWLLDAVKSTAIGALFAAGGGALALGLMRRLPRRWWIAGAGLVVAFEVVFVWLAPVVLAPLFNKYEDLPAGRTRDQLIELARDNGIDVDKVQVVDASRRTTAINAYVTGIGHTKRIVLYDNLLDDYTPAQVRLVVAHELGHVKQDDVPRGLLWVALFAPGAMYVVMLLTVRWSRRAGSEPGRPGALPALALSLALVSATGMVISNQLSRRIEQRADQFSIEATGEPRQFVELERRLAISNVSRPSPPAVFQWLLGTHPTTMQRIGAALRYEQQHPQRPQQGGDGASR